MGCNCFEVEEIEVSASVDMDQVVFVFAGHKIRYCERRKQDELTSGVLIGDPVKLEFDIDPQNSWLDILLQARTRNYKRLTELEGACWW